jgi:hypothetical protein
MRQNIQKKFKQAIYISSITVLGIALGFALQIASAWMEPTVAPPGGNLGAPLNTSAIAQTKEGSLTLNHIRTLNGMDVGNAGGAYTYLTLRDDESPNGVKYIHANSNVVGFLNGHGNWISYWHNNGDSYQVGNGNVSDVYIRAAGKWASQMGVSGGFCVFKRTGYSCPSWAPAQEGLQTIGFFGNLDDQRTGGSGHGYNITVCCGP